MSACARETKQTDSPTWTDVVAPDDDDDGDDEWGAIAAVDSGWKGSGGLCRPANVYAHTACRARSSFQCRITRCQYIELCSTGMPKAMKQPRKRCELYQQRIVSLRVQRMCRNECSLYQSNLWIEPSAQPDSTWRISPNLSHGPTSQEDTHAILAYSSRDVKSVTGFTPIKATRSSPFGRHRPMPRR